MSNKAKDQSRVKQAAIHQSGLDGLDAETFGTVIDTLTGLIAANWPQIDDIRKQSDESTVSIAIGVEVNSSGKVPLVKTRIGYAQKYKDEAECWVNDPNQPNLPIDE
jgi:hypothetical protein